MRDLRQQIQRFNAQADRAAVLGGEGSLQRQSSTHGGEWAGPCPLCGGADRLRVWPLREPTARAWCRRCKTSGDALRWAMLVAGVDPAERGATARFLKAAPFSARRQVGRVRLEVSNRSSLDPQAVAALWERCGLVSGSPEVRRYLVGRRLDSAAIERLGLARALPRRGQLPRWARARTRIGQRGSWRDLGYQLVLPMWDHQGHLGGTSPSSSVRGLCGDPPAPPRMLRRGVTLAPSNRRLPTLRTKRR